jgi:adenine deaminase
MKTRRTLLSLALTAFACVSSLHAQSLLISGGTLIDATGGAAIQDSQILIRDGMIAEVRRSGASEPPGGVDVVDARGKFIIPGLIDSHVHYGDTYAELFLCMVSRRSTISVIPINGSRQSRKD